MKTFPTNHFPVRTYEPQLLNNSVLRTESIIQSTPINCLNLELRGSRLLKFKPDQIVNPVLAIVKPDD